MYRMKHLWPIGTLIIFYKNRFFGFQSFLRETNVTYVTSTSTSRFPPTVHELKWTFGAGDDNEEVGLKPSHNYRHKELNECIEQRCAKPFILLLYNHRPNYVLSGLYVKEQHKCVQQWGVEMMHILFYNFLFVFLPVLSILGDVALPVWYVPGGWMQRHSCS